MTGEEKRIIMQELFQGFNGKWTGDRILSTLCEAVAMLLEPVRASDAAEDWGDPWAERRLREENDE